MLTTKFCCKLNGRPSVSHADECVADHQCIRYRRAVGPWGERRNHTTTLLDLPAGFFQCVCNQADWRPLAIDRDYARLAHQRMVSFVIKVVGFTGSAIVVETATAFLAEHSCVSELLLHQ